jgi:dihydrofolate reductase
MKKICYAVAASLDGYIAGPKGEADWIIIDPEMNFEALFKRFDTVLMGRRTFAAMEKIGQGPISGMETFVFTRTLEPRK